MFYVRVNTKEQRQECENERKCKFESVYDKKYMNLLIISVLLMFSYHVESLI